MFSNVFEKTCAKVVSEPGLIDKLREEKYDVFIAESFDLCGIGTVQTFFVSYLEIFQVSRKQSIQNQ